MTHHHEQQQTHQSGAPHGTMGQGGGSNFPQSSSPMPPVQSQMNLPPSSGPQGMVGGQVHNQVAMQQYLKLVMQQQQQQQQMAHGMLLQQQAMTMLGSSSRDQDMINNPAKMHELMALQAQMFKRQPEHLQQAEKQKEQGQPSSDEQRNRDMRSPMPPPGVPGQQLPSAGMMRPMQPMQGQVGISSTGGGPLTPLQFQAIQAWAKDNNFDLSNPANISAISQLLPIWQSSRMAAVQKQNGASMAAQQQATPSQVNSDTSGRGSVPNQGAPSKPGQPLPPSSVSGREEAKVMNSSNLQLQQQLSARNRDGSNERAVRLPVTVGDGRQMMMHIPQSSGHVSKVPEQSTPKIALANSEAMQVQHGRQMQQPNQAAAPTASPGETGGSQAPIPSARLQTGQTGFTKNQLHVLKAQILAFRRLKRGDRTLPPEVLELIVSGQSPPDSQGQQNSGPQAMHNCERPGVSSADEHGGHIESCDKVPEKPALLKGPCLSKVEASASEDKTSPANVPGTMQVMKASPKESLKTGPVSVPQHSNTTMIKSEHDIERDVQRTPMGNYNSERGKSLPAESGSADAGQAKRAGSASSAPPPRDVSRKYHGPLFDFPSFTKRHDSLGTANYNSNLSLGYDVKDLLAQEGLIVLDKKREDNLRKISGLLAINLERKRICPDLVLRLQIEEKKLKLLEHQARLRDEVEHEQQEIMAMPDRIYRKFVKQCERQRAELARHVQQMQKASREKQLKSIFQWRKKLLEAHWAIRDARITRNRGVAKYHERMVREFSKRKDDDRNKRMEALKNNDVERYRQILLEQQTSVPGDAAQRYNVLSSFLTQTEEYLYKLGGKITATKSQQQIEEAANAAAAAARAQGLSEEEVKAAAQCAGQEVMIRNTFSEMNAPRDNTSVNKYYTLAHAVSERVTKQPSLLRAGTLREYQLVGLQWMLSLYNNKLNGILADEMGLGKTVQVMALIAYLMEFKGNYGPHLIIVPNAVLVNWKSELLNWLPSASSIFYVGAKDQRQKLFSQEVLAMKFNILVTTYEFVMFDRSKLSKIDWKYIIIDEAQRMKDRDSVLARDLDRYRCQRRLLLTGTPLQNDLKELWSLLNLLLPEVFDSSKAFQDWFSKPFQRDGPTHSEEDDWLETEKKVIIIHRLHQILEPFMLRRRVEDVEGSLPRKDSIVLRCRMSAVQGAIYDWIKSTGTIRVDPEDEKTRAQRNPMYQLKTYKNLNNKCMELRKVCNHPLLSYPFLNHGKDFMIRSCGKLWNLDRILIKLHKAGHRVLLFSTMTKLLDIMEDYLQWRRLVYRRIDGTTSLEDRESAIVDFNRPGSDCFIFLLSIRAAGRGLNLQSADTVVIYDPDPNPQNEEQAVARAHRIGQTREVKVIYMEAVVDNISSYQKEDELRNGGSGDLEDDLAGKDRYMGSIESLIRNNIQQYKIDMADEVINAGRFDQRTTHEERRMTLETLLHDDERYQETVHDVPSLQEVNRMIARTEREVELFDQMDEDFDWTGDMTKHHQVPKWLRASSNEVDAVVASLSKKLLRSMVSGGIALDTNDTPEKRRGRPKGTGKYSIYREIDDEDLEESDEDSDERNTTPLPENEEIGEFEDEEDNDDSVPDNKDESEEEEPINDDGCNFPDGIRSRKANRMEEAASTGSSSGSRRLPPPAPSSSSKKLRSLSALDARPGSLSRRTPDDLEEGEIAMSGDSHMDLQHSGSWNHERDDGEDEQVLQPKIKRKRSIRIRPRVNAEKTEDRSGGEAIFPQRAARQQDTVHPMVKQKHNMPSRKVSPASRTGKSTYLCGSGEGSAEHSKENWSSKAMDSSTPEFRGTKMSDSMQRKCKNVISKLWRRIDKEGHQIIPNISSWWRRNENSSFRGPAGSTLDLQKIEQRVDGFEYSAVTEFIGDMQQMLKSVVQHFSYRHEARIEAETLHNLFFNIMNIAFPDSDFSKAKNAMSFSNPGRAASGTAGPSTKHAALGHKRRASTSEAEQHGSGHIKHNKSSEVPSRPHSSRSERDSRHSGSGGRDQLPDGAGLLHPSDMFIVKKKRQERARSSIGSPSSSGRAGPLSPTNPVRLGMVPSPRGARAPFQRDAHPSQHSMHSTGWVAHSDQGGSSSAPGIGDIQWAKPSKRQRTDSGKRRPSHL